jgi:hypothetical protein
MCLSLLNIHASNAHVDLSNFNLSINGGSSYGVTATTTTLFKPYHDEGGTDNCIKL